MYEVFEHTADLGLRVRAATLDDLLRDAARGLTSIIAGDLEAVRPAESVAIDVRGTDPAYLLFDWLAEILFLFEVRRLLLRDFKVSVGPEGLHGVARGERLDPHRHRLLHEVKAITYHGLAVRRIDSEWEAEVIVDI
jgi:SHS2 domain-containing protein